MPFSMALGSRASRGSSARRSSWPMVPLASSASRSRRSRRTRRRSVRSSGGRCPTRFWTVLLGMLGSSMMRSTAQSMGSSSGAGWSGPEDSRLGERVGIVLAIILSFVAAIKNGTGCPWLKLRAAARPPEIQGLGLG